MTAFPKNEVAQPNEFVNELTFAIEEIYRQHGVRTRIGRKGLRKYGRNPDLDTADGITEVNALGINETYLSDNLITHAVSSSGSDTGQLYIEGMTLSGGIFTFITQTITLTGQTKVALTTPLARVTRVRYLGVSNNIGDIYVMEDEAVTGGVPDDINDAHALALAGTNNSLKAATSVSNTNFFIMTYWRGSVGRQAAASCDFQLNVRTIGSTPFIVTDTESAASGSAGFIIKEPPFLIVPPNSDISIDCDTSANNTDVKAGFGGYFADIIG